MSPAVHACDFKRSTAQTKYSLFNASTLYRPCFTRKFCRILEYCCRRQRHAGLYVENISARPFRHTRHDVARTHTYTNESRGTVRSVRHLIEIEFEPRAEGAVIGRRQSQLSAKNGPPRRYCRLANYFDLQISQTDRRHRPSRYFDTIRTASGRWWLCTR